MSNTACATGGEAGSVSVRRRGAVIRYAAKKGARMGMRYRGASRTSRMSRRHAAGTVCHTVRATQAILRYAVKVNGGGSAAGWNCKQAFVRSVALQYGVAGAQMLQKGWRNV